MGDGPVSVLDTNVLINLALPVVDQRDHSPSGEDPLKTVLTLYDVHIPSAVLGEITAIARGSDLLGVAGDLVLQAAGNLSTHDLDEFATSVEGYGLDIGETQAINLANELRADLFVSDEFNSANLQLIHLAIYDRNVVYTTPHLLCELAWDGVLDGRYVNHTLTYYIETRHWDGTYIDRLRDCYINRE